VKQAIVFLALIQGLLTAGCGSGDAGKAKPAEGKVKVEAAGGDATNVLPGTEARAIVEGKTVAGPAGEVEAHAGAARGTDVPVGAAARSDQARPGEGGAPPAEDRPPP